MNTPGATTGGVERLATKVGRRLDGSPLLVMLDVDGTLAPIAPTPEQAAVPPATRETLRRLIALPHTTVALVSGRSAADTWRLAGVAGAWVIGNHGFELRTPDGQISADAAVRPFESVVGEAARRLDAAQPAIPGAFVENKRWTISLHYRLVDTANVPDLRSRALEVATALGLRVTEGKKIIELRPPVDVNKGTATLSLAERTGALGDGAAAFYAGDDRTDEDAFRALRARSSEAVTVHIRGADDEHAHPTAAELTLASPEELRAALDWLVARRLAVAG